MTLNQCWCCGKKCTEQLELVASSRRPPLQEQDFLCVAQKARPDAMSSPEHEPFHVRGRLAREEAYC